MVSMDSGVRMSRPMSPDDPPLSRDRRSWTLRQALRVFFTSAFLCLWMLVGAQQVMAAPSKAPKTEATTVTLTVDTEAKPRINPSIQAIRDSGVLRIGLAYPDNLPFYGHDKDGNLIGYDVDMALGMARSMGVKPIFSQPKVTYTRLIQLASADQVDVAFGKLSVTIPRLAYAEPVPYMNLRQSLLINRKVLDSISPNQNNIGANLRSATIRIGVIRGSSHAVWGSTTFPKARFETYANWQDCIEALSKHEVDALFRDGFETARIVKSNPGLAVEYVPIILKDRIDNIAMYVGPRMEGLQPTAHLYVDITTGVVNEEDLFRTFKSEMKHSFVSRSIRHNIKTAKDKPTSTNTNGSDA